MPSSGGQPSRKDTGGTVGRGDAQGSDASSSGGHHTSSSCSPPRAGVVIHATVEHIGLVGDTELSVHVKWPASTFCVQASKKPPASDDQTSDSQSVPENGPDSLLWGEAADAGPYIEVKPPVSKSELGHTSTKSDTQASSETEKKPPSSS